MTGYVPAWAAFLTGFLVLLFGGSFGVWLGFGLGLEHAERPGPEWTAAELEGLADRPRFRRPPVEVAHQDPGVMPRLPFAPEDLWAFEAHSRQAVALANSGSDEERVAAAMADLDVFMTRLLADHPEEGP